MGIDAEWDGRTQLVQAWMLLADGKTPTARRMFAAMPVDFWVRFGLAESTLAEGQAGEAALLFAEAELLWRDRETTLRAPAIARRAVCLAECGEPEYAAYLCESALNEVTEPAARLWLCCAGARVWAGRRRITSAREALANAESIDFRKAADTYHQLGTTLRRSGATAEAVPMLDRAVELLARTRLHPGLGHCHLVRARELGQTGALAEAIDHAHRAVPWVQADALCELADLYRRARRFDEARRFAKHAQEAAKGLSETARAQRVMGLIAADATPDHAEILLRQAADTYARAAEDLEVAETMRLLGLFLAGRERLREAVSCLDQACATVLAPRSPRS
jgi:tetratricopeptide (TPR) repeat protein